MDLLQKSDRIKEDAYRLLKESNLQEILSSYGEVKIVGSYALNVMLRPDLDIYVLAEENSKENMLQVVNKIFASDYFDEICYANWVDFNLDKGKIKGYYVQPNVTIGENRWKLDIWLMTKAEFKPVNEEFVQSLASDQNSEKRLAILQLKEALSLGKKYIKGVDGNLIYEAVLKNGVKDKDSFMKFLETKNNRQ